ncbi:MAG: tetratricopeptide repeat protein [Myxococcales bacterium]|nr:tetratricopeptide repeat protein [Myxococcales bacterium]
MPRLRLASALMLPALVFAALYLRSLDYDLVWTDVGEIEAGTLIRPLDGLLDVFVQPMHANLDFRLAGVPQSFYRPLQVVLLSVIHDRQGTEPRGYRALSLGLGAATAIVFTAFAWTLFGRWGLALLAGTIFAAHPGGIEVYVWIAGLSAALADFFVVGSVFAAALALRTSRSGCRIALALLSVAAFVLGLASKEHAVVTPALVLACSVSLAALDRFEAAGRRRAQLAAAAALVLVQGLIALAYVVWWRPHVLGGAFTGASPIGGSLETHALSSLALWPRNLLWLFVPWQSTTSDVVRVVTSFFDPMVWLGLLLAAASLAAWLWLLRRGHAVAALGLAWVWIAYLPTCGVVPLLHARAERNLCLSIFGAALLWPALGAPLLRRLWPLAPRAVAAGLAALVVLGLGQRSWARIPDWRSDLTLFASDVARDPVYREGRFELAIALHGVGRGREAKQQIEVLLDPGPAFAGRSSYLRVANVYELYCLVNRTLGADGDTLRVFDERYGGKTAAVASLPGFFFCIAGALEQAGRVEEALDVYTRLLRIGGEPGRSVFGVAIARCHARLGRYADARRWLDQAETTGVRDPAIDAQVRDVRRLIRRAARQPAQPEP